VIRPENVQRRNSGAVAGARIYPVDMESAIDQILAVNPQFILRLDQRVLRLGKIVHSFASPVPMIRADIQNVLWIESKLLYQREEIA